MWKNKLEDADELSFATLQNKDAAWEKLYARLEKKPTQKRVVWYWLAAACLILALTISMFIMHHPATPLASNNYKNNTVKKPVTKQNEPLKNIVTEISTIKIQHQLQKNIVAKNDIKKSVIIDTSSNISPLVINNKDGLQTKVTTSPVMVDTTATAATTILQKKLKVVHVNELGEPVEINETATRNTDLHLFQLKLAQQEIYNASSTASANNGNFSFKPKNLQTKIA